MLRVFALFGLCVCLGCRAGAPAKHGEERGRNEPMLAAAGDQPIIEGYFPGESGVRLFYRSVGAGSRTLVFIHGGPGIGIEDGGLDLEAIASRGYRFLMYDQRGGGRSELITDAARLTIRSHVADLDALRTHFNLDRLNLIGLSWGAAIATQYADSFPEHVEGIAFLSPMEPASEFTHARDEHVAQVLGNEVHARVTEIWGRWNTASDAELPGICRESMRLVFQAYVTNPSHLDRARGDWCMHPPNVLRNMTVVNAAGIGSLGRTFDFRPMLSRIRVPVIVVEGERSNVPIDATRQWAQAVAHARFALIPNAGHQHWLDQPEAVIAALDEFFRAPRSP